MRRIHIYGIHSYECDTRWLNKRSLSLVLYECVWICNLLLVVTNDSCLRQRNQRSWCEFPFMYATDCNLNSMPFCCFFSSFASLRSHREQTKKTWQCQTKKNEYVLFQKRGNNKSYYRFIGLIKWVCVTLFFGYFCTDCWFFLFMLPTQMQSNHMQKESLLSYAHC